MNYRAARLARRSISDNLGMFRREVLCLSQAGLNAGALAMLSCTTWHQIYNRIRTTVAPADRSANRRLADRFGNWPNFNTPQLSIPVIAPRHRLYPNNHLVELYPALLSACRNTWSSLSNLGVDPHLYHVTDFRRCKFKYLTGVD